MSAKFQPISAHYAPAHGLPAMSDRSVYNLASNDIWVTCAPILCWALLLAVIVRSVKTMAFLGKYLKIVESGYTQLPVLQLKSPTFPKSLEVHYERETGVSLCAGYFPENVHFIAGTKFQLHAGSLLDC